MDDGPTMCQSKKDVNTFLESGPLVFEPGMRIDTRTKEHMRTGVSQRRDSDVKEQTLCTVNWDFT